MSSSTAPFQLFALWLFSRRGECIYFQEWNPTPANGTNGNTDSSTSEGSDGGMLSPLRQLQQAAVSAATGASSTPSSGGSSAAASAASSSQPSSDYCMVGSGRLAPEEIHKLMYGMLYSLKRMVEQCAPTTAAKPGADGGLKGFKTNTYRLHFFESPSRLKIVLMTDPRAPELNDALQKIYSNIYVEHVTKNPRYDAVNGTEQITVENCEVFIQNLQLELAQVSRKR